MTTIIKWLCFTFNIVMLFIALVFFSGISIVADQFTTGTVIGFIVVCVLFLLISILGCWGAYKEDALLMKASAISLLGMFIYGLVFKLVIVVYNRDALKSLVEEKWAEELKYPESDSMAFVQWAYHCCGKHSPMDYLNLFRTIPATCTILTGEIYVKGCLETVEAHVSPLEEIIFPKQFFIVIVLTFASACYLIWYFTKRQLDNDP